MEKVESKFLFKPACRNNVERADMMRDATVLLHINYQHKTYSIIPANGDNNFSFVDTSYLNAMRKSVLKSIEDAIDFANKEIEDAK